MTKLQELLGRILKNRIEREKADGTLTTDKSSVSDTLDIFLAGNKITSDQYSELTDLITPAAATSTTTTGNTSSTNDNSKTTTDTSKTA